MLRENVSDVTVPRMRLKGAIIEEGTYIRILMKRKGVESSLDDPPEAVRIISDFLDGKSEVARLLLRDDRGWCIMARHR